MLNITIKDIRQALYKADKASDIKLLDTYITSYTEVNDVFSEDAFALIIKILTTAVLFTKKGMPFLFCNFIYVFDFF